MEYTKGSRVQRKGSTVIWTVTGHNHMALPAGQTYGIASVDLGIDGATEIHVTCIAKRNGKMSKWIDRATFEKNWKVVA